MGNFYFQAYGIFFIFVLFPWSVASVQNITETYDVLVDFFDAHILACTIRFILEPAQLQAQTSIAKISTASRNTHVRYPTYTVETYNQSFLSSVAIFEIRDGNISSYTLRSSQHPFWIYSNLQRRCWVHLYFIESQEELDIAIDYNFVDFDLRREEPRYIIFWNIATDSNSIFWSKAFLSQNFYSHFQDTRLVIQKENGAEHLSMVCIICSLLGSPVLHSLPEQPSEGTIRSMWRELHRNLHQMTLPCVYCDYYKESLDTRNDLIGILTHLHNISITTDHDDGIPPLGIITAFYYLDPTGISQTVYMNRSPSLFVASAAFMPVPYQLMTVAPMDILSSRGLFNALVPFQLNVWTTIIVWIFGICYFFRKVSGRNHVRLTVSSTILMVVAPMTDHTCTFPFLNSKTKLVLLLHAVVCYSLTVLYGGEIASSMSVLLTPFYPVSIKQLITTANQPWSVTTDYPNGNLRSYLGAELLHMSTIVQDNQEKSRLFQAANSLNRHFCPQMNINLNFDIPNRPLSCSADYNMNLDWSQPVTLIMLNNEFPPFQRLFEILSQYWVSPLVTLTQHEKTYPYFILNNYFGRLVMPTIRAWWVSGIRVYWHTKFVKEYKLRKWRILKRIYNYSNKPKPEVFKFEPTTLKSVATVGALFYILYPTCVLAFAAEIFSKMDGLRPLQAIIRRALIDTETVLDTNVAQTRIGLVERIIVQLCHTTQTRCKSKNQRKVTIIK